MTARSDKELKEYFGDADTRGFIAWLITDDNIRALRNYPGIEHNLSQVPFDLEKVLAKNYQCNYRTDHNCNYLVYDSFWNIFEKSPNWTLAAPVSGIGVADNISYKVKKRGKLIAYIGSSNKTVILNFID